MRRKEFRINNKYLKLLFQTKTDYTEWFGYYNYDVINYDGRRMLCNRASFDGRAISTNDTLELGWYGLNDGKWNNIGETNSFNWPQGAMLQWLPGSISEVIYNRAQNGHFQSVIYNTDTKEERIIESPVYCVHPSGDYAITLNYERSYWCRAYHYQSIVNEKYNVRIANDDGVFKVDLHDGTSKRIIDIKDIVKLDSIPSFQTCKHWLEHVMLNPTGNRLALLHRFTTADGYGTRIITARTDGTELAVVEGWKDHDYSHLGWIDDDSFVIYSVVRLSPYTFSCADNRTGESKKNKQPISIKIKKSVRNIIPPRLIDLLRGRKKGYDVFRVNNSQFQYTRSFNQSIFCIDGHPSFTADGRYMITDTYPDNKGYRKLIIYDTLEDNSYIVGRFFSPLRRTPAACDLHPKLCFHDSIIVVDTACSGKHRMFAFNINWRAIKGEATYDETDS